MNQSQMMAQMRKVQQEMTKAQEELAATVVTGSAAGDTITVQMSCDYRVEKVTVKKEAVDPDDIETLEDLLVVAFNDAVHKAQETSSARMGAVTGGIRIPGLM